MFSILKFSSVTFLIFIHLISFCDIIINADAASTAYTAFSKSAPSPTLDPGASTSALLTATTNDDGSSSGSSVDEIRNTNGSEDDREISSSVDPIGSESSTVDPIGSENSSVNPIGSESSTVGPIGSESITTSGPSDDGSSTSGPSGDEGSSPTEDKSTDDTPDDGNSNDDANDDTAGSNDTIEGTPDDDNADIIEDPEIDDTIPGEDGDSLDGDDLDNYSDPQNATLSYDAYIYEDAISGNDTNIKDDNYSSDNPDYNSDDNITNPIDQETYYKHNITEGNHFSYYAAQSSIILSIAFVTAGLLIIAGMTYRNIVKIVPVDKK